MVALEGSAFPRSSAKERCSLALLPQACSNASPAFVLVPCLAPPLTPASRRRMLTSQSYRSLRMASVPSTFRSSPRLLTHGS